jgi:ABC-type Fe3+ transport system permease subunit
LIKKYIFWFISILLSFLGFYVIENTFTIKPNVISGNGNLGILIIMLLSPIFILSYYLTYKLGREVSYNATTRKLRVFILSLAFICCSLLIFPIVNYTNELIIALGGTPSNHESRIYRFGWFNQYTNSMYFNVYTFLLTHTLAVIIGILSAIRKNKTNGVPN